MRPNVNGSLVTDLIFQDPGEREIWKRVICVQPFRVFELCSLEANPVTAPLESGLFVGAHSVVVRNGESRAFEVDEMKRIRMIRKDPLKFWRNIFHPGKDVLQLDALAKCG